MIDQGIGRGLIFLKYNDFKDIINYAERNIDKKKGENVIIQDIKE